MYTPLIFWLTVVGAIFLVNFLVSRTKSSSSNTGETPLQILDRRLASGEITADDYNKARDLLTEGGKP